MAVLRLTLSAVRPSILLPPRGAEHTCSWAGPSGAFQLQQHKTDMSQPQKTSGAAHVTRLWCLLLSLRSGWAPPLLLLCGQGHAPTGQKRAPREHGELPRHHPSGQGGGSCPPAPHQQARRPQQPPSLRDPRSCQRHFGWMGTGQPGSPGGKITHKGRSGGSIDAKNESPTPKLVWGQPSMLGFGL